MISKTKTFIIRHKFSFIFGIIIVIMSFVDLNLGKNALNIAFGNMKTMMGVIPPIFMLIGLLDVWVPKETMIKYMGDNSGVLGLFFAFLLGAMAAGPLYAAFPIAALLLKKGARFAYAIFFLGVWSCAKIPLLLFEMTSLGVKFTVIHVTSMLIMYLAGALIIEKMLQPHEKNEIVKRVEAL